MLSILRLSAGSVPAVFLPLPVDPVPHARVPRGEELVVSTSHKELWVQGQGPGSRVRVQRVRV